MNPNYAFAHDQFSLLLAFLGRYDEARQQVARADYLDPSFFFVPWSYGWIELQTGNIAAAIPHLERARDMQSPAFTVAWSGYAYGMAGERAKALATIDELGERSLHGYVSPFNLAIVYLGLGDDDAALTHLEQSYDMDIQWLCWLGKDRIFDPLRANPRFQALLKKLHFES